MPIRVPTPGFEDGAFYVCKMMYTSVWSEPQGVGWATDYPYAGHNLMIRLSELTKTPVSRDSGGDPNYWVVRLTDADLFRCPFLMAADVGTLQFDPARSGPAARVPAEGRLPLGRRLLGDAGLAAVVLGDPPRPAGVPAGRRAGGPSHPPLDVRHRHAAPGHQHQLVAPHRRRHARARRRQPPRELQDDRRRRTTASWS